MVNIFGFQDVGSDSTELESMFESYAPGQYNVTGIGRWIAVDDKGLPVFMVSQLSEELEARFTLKVEGTDDGPPMSGTARDLVSILMAMGVPLHELAKLKIENTSEFLQKVERLFSKTTKKAVAYVGKRGWISSVNGTELPTGQYVMKVARYYEKDGELTLIQRYKKYDNENYFMHVVFEVVADQFGKPSMFNGFQQGVWVEDPFTGTYGTADDGSIYPITKTRTVRTKSGEEKEFTARAVTYFSGMASALVEEFDPSVWETKPDIPAQTILEAALEAGKYVLVSIAPNKVGVNTIRIDSIIPYDGDVEESGDEVNASKALYDLTVYIDKLAGFKVFDKDFSVTEKGAQWCRGNIIDLWNELNLPESRKFIDLTDEQVAELRAGLAKNDTAGF